MGLKSLENLQSSFDNYSATTGTGLGFFCQSNDLGVQATGGTTNTYFIETQNINPTPLLMDKPFK